MAYDPKLVSCGPQKLYPTSGVTKVVQMVQSALGDVAKGSEVHWGT